MLRLAGRLADGTITGATGPRGLAEHVVPLITKAAADAGRPPPRIVAAVVACITDDADAARGQDRGDVEAVRRRCPSFRRCSNARESGARSTSGLIGDEATARAQAQRFIDAGATELAIREATGTPEEARANTCVPQEPARRLSAIAALVN